MLTDTALCNLKSKPKPYKASDQAVDIFVAPLAGQNPPPLAGLNSPT